MDTASKNWVKEIRIDLDICKSCKMCVGACFVDVIRWDEKRKKPIAAYPEDCVWCLACEAACSVNAIEVIPIIPAPLRTSY
jgi:NAD-dependent dihydropyrimidine dehydrogenase PreA subunit